jgi:transposase-like protein
MERIYELRTICSKMHAIYCPRCKSPKIQPYLGGMTGSYRCMDCGYMGSLVIEKTDFMQAKDVSSKRTRPPSKRA